MQQTPLLHNFYQEVHAIICSNDMEKCDSDTIFKNNEKNCAWLKQDYAETIPKYFNFLNEEKMTLYIDYIASLTTNIKLSLENSQSLKLSKQENRSLHEQYNAIINDDVCGEQEKDFLCSLESKTLTIQSENSKKNPFTVDILEIPQMIDFDIFKKDEISTAMLLKSYARFLYAFGLIIDDLNCGSIKKITENCYTFSNGQKIIASSPMEMALCFTIVLLCLFFCGFEQHAGYLFKFLCNESQNLSLEFNNYWSKNCTVFIMSYLIEKSGCESIVQLRNSNRFYKNDNNTNDINNGSTNSNNVKDMEVDLKNISKILFDESYFKDQNNRLLGKENICLTKLCRCGIKMIPIVQKTYKRYKNNYKNMKFTQTTTTPLTTPRANYLNFIRKKQFSNNKTEYSEKQRSRDLATTQSLALCADVCQNDTDNQQNTVRQTRLLENNSFDVGINTNSSKYKISMSETKMKPKKRIKKIRYVKKGQLGGVLSLYRPPICMNTCVFWFAGKISCDQLSFVK